MKLLFVLLLGTIGFTADGAFAMGMMGEAMNQHAETVPNLGMGVIGDVFAVVILLVSIIFRVRHLVRTAANPVPIRRY